MIQLLASRIIDHSMVININDGMSHPCELIYFLAAKLILIIT